MLEELEERKLRPSTDDESMENPEDVKAEDIGDGEASQAAAPAGATSLPFRPIPSGKVEEDKAKDEVMDRSE